MKRDQFVETFMEGLNTGTSDYEKTTTVLVGMLFEARAKNALLTEKIEGMDDIARDNTIEVRCRSCQKDYVPDCELSELEGSEFYCGGSEWCCP